MKSLSTACLVSSKHDTRLAPFASTLSDLVHEHAASSEADIEWLHLLIADGQLIAEPRRPGDEA